MKRILFLITKSEIGGAQKWTKEQIDICNKSFECYLASNQVGWLTKNSKVKSVFCSKLIERRSSLNYMFLLYRFIKNNNIEIVVSSSANAGIYARLLKLFVCKLKIVYVSHGWSAVYNGKNFKFLYIFAEKMLSQLSNSILCVSAYDYNIARKDIGINKKKLKLISNSIFPPEDFKYKKQIGNIKLLCVARAAPPKRIDLLIDAVRNLNVELHIVGDGELLCELKKSTLDNVFFHGELNNFSKFREYDIFCLISESEGLPLSGLEAMSYGLPLILSNVGGCSELINDNGNLVENKFECIEKAILENIDKLKFRGLKSKILFNEKFNLNNNEYKYIEYYDSL